MTKLALGQKGGWFMRRIFSGLLSLIVALLFLAFSYQPENQRYQPIDDFMATMRTNYQELTWLNATISDAKLKGQLVNFMEGKNILQARYQVKSARKAKNQNDIVWVLVTLKYTGKNGVPTIQMTFPARFVLTPEGTILKSNLFLMLMLTQILVLLLLGHLAIAAPFMIHAGLNRDLEAAGMLMTCVFFGVVIYCREYVNKENRLLVIMLAGSIWFLLISIVGPILLVSYFLPGSS